MSTAFLLQIFYCIVDHKFQKHKFYANIMKAKLA